MSVTMARGDGVTAVIMTSDPQSACPPLCQILKGLCCSPVCCTVSQHLRGVQTSQSVLGALQIMIGLLNIGLGAILWCGDAGPCPLFPFWLGGVFIFFGSLNILSEKCPSPCLVILNVILNLAGVGFAIAAIILYSINIVQIYFWWLCNPDYDDYVTRPSPSPEEELMEEKCLEGKALALMLFNSINALLIVLSVLELCVVISSAVLGIKTLRSSGKGEEKSIGEPEHYTPLLEEVTSNPAA